MSDENKSVQQQFSEDAFRALETAPVTTNPIVNPNAPIDGQQGQGTTQHMGQPPADGAPGSSNEEQVDLSKQPVAAQAAPATQPAAPAATATFEQLLEQRSKGSYKTWDEVQAAIDKPPVEKVVEKPVEKIVTQPLAFPNEQAQKFYEAVAAGKFAETAPFIQQHVFRAQIDTMTPEQIVKAHIQKEYPSFDANDVQAEYDVRYKPDEHQLNAADFARETKKANDRLAKDAKAAKEEFLRIEPKLELPTTQAAQPAAPDIPQLSEEAKPIVAYGASLKIDQVTKFPFEFEPQDKSTKISGEAGVPAEAVTAVQEKIQSNPEAFLAGFIGERWSQANGELDPAAIARDVAFITNPSAWANAIAQQAYLQTYTAKLQRDRNYQPEANRGDASGIMPTTAEEDREKLRAFHGIPPKR